MPVMIVYGVPDSYPEEKLTKLCGSLCGLVQGTRVLNLGPNDVSAFFPRDRLQAGLGQEIIVFVDGLFEKPERTETVRNDLARRIMEFLRVYFPKSLVEVFIRPFNPRQGFATSAQTPAETTDDDGHNFFCGVESGPRDPKR